MKIFKHRREQLNQSLRQVAEACGMSAARLSEIERGLRHPRPEVVEKLCTHLGVKHQALPPADLPLEVKRQLRTQPDDVVRPVTRQTWCQRCEDAYPTQLSQLKNLPDLAWMDELCHFDSSLEPLGVFQFLDRGATMHAGNPHSYGFDGWPVLDHSGRLLGARRLPFLSFAAAQYRLLIWPQVSMRIWKYVQRVDFLCLIRKRRSSLWGTMEIDGAGHDFRRDRHREQLIALPTRRFREEDVLKLRFPEEVERAWGLIREVSRAS